MSVATLLWIVAVSGLVTGVAGALSSALRRLHRPERWVWVVALSVTAALPVLPALAPPTGSDSDAPLAATRVVPIAQVVTFASSSLPEPARVSVPWIPMLWGGASVATVVLMLGGAWSLARRRERWPRRRVDGDLLRVSDRFGPAVVGWVDPEIVLPAWAVDLDPRRRRLILRHENEHRWAKDPQLLALGVLLLAAAPWNPFAWLQFRGLRRGVEFDCDARVLGSGASPRAYGRLLLSVQLDGGRRGALFAPALREPASFLERRLQTMKLRDRPVARLRVAGLALVAITLTVVACETPRPTEASGPSESPATSEASATAGSTDDLIRATPTIFAKSASYPENALVMRPLGGGVIEVVRGDTSQMIRLHSVEAVARTHTLAEGEESVIVEVDSNSRAADVDRLNSELRDAGVDRVVVVHLQSATSGDDPPKLEVVEVPPDEGALADARQEVLDLLPTVDAASVESARARIEDLGYTVVETEDAVEVRYGKVLILRTPSLASFSSEDGRLTVRGVESIRAGERVSAEGLESIELWEPESATAEQLSPGADASSILGPRLEGSPLIYVDGVRIGTELDVRADVLRRIHPDDIERIEVIKGTTAETLYGADAAGGVIQIFTKKNR